MNITALKAMVKHWKPILATILAVCDELRTRPGVTRDRWTIGELHVLSCVVLALPAFQLMKRFNNEKESGYEDQDQDPWRWYQASRWVHDSRAVKHHAATMQQA